MNAWQKEWPIKGFDFSRAGDGAMQLKDVMRRLGLPGDVIRRASVGAYEAELNVIILEENIWQIDFWCWVVKQFELHHGDCRLSPRFLTDEAAVIEFLGRRPPDEPAVVVHATDAIVKFKPELVTSEYRTLTDEQRQIAQAVLGGANTPESILEVTDLPAARVMTALTLLELDGVLGRENGVIVIHKK